MTPKQKLITKVGAASAALLLSMVPVFEGYRPSVYKDPIGRLAVCYGHDDQSMKLGTTYTRQQCEAMLADDLLKHADALACINRPLSDGQKAAFVSFAFNVGNKAFCGSTLARKANAGDMAGACAELSRWTLAGGKQLPGLVKRRAVEREVCES
ncbi:MAG: lysozyme [Ottowia sp.]|uniref:lysozyme n=1 Tax=Ottowia sp. TaxID=1898956 RepID=UPI003C7325BE